MTRPITITTITTILIFLLTNFIAPTNSTPNNQQINIIRKQSKNPNNQIKLYLIGPSGSGKSTLGNYLLGQPNPQKGIFNTNNYMPSHSTKNDNNQNGQIKVSSYGQIFNQVRHGKRVQVIDTPSFFDGLEMDFSRVGDFQRLVNSGFDDSKVGFVVVLRVGCVECWR